MFGEDEIGTQVPTTPSLLEPCFILTRSHLNAWVTLIAEAIYSLPKVADETIAGDWPDFLFFSFFPVIFLSVSLL